MANDKNIKQFTAEDIKRYHQGLLSPKEKHDLEKAALDDPFLADALEGYAYAGSDAARDLADLEKRLATRTGTGNVIPLKGGRQFSPFMKAAAMILILATAGLFVYQFAFNNKDSALVEEKSGSTAKIETIADGKDTPAAPSTVDTGTGLFIKPNSKKDKIEEAVTTNDGRTVKKESGAVTTTDNTTGQKDEAVAIVTDNKSQPAGEAPVAAAPSKPEINTETAGKGTEKEPAPEEVKTRAAGIARKKETDNDAQRKNSVQQPDDSRNARDLSVNRQSDDKYYRNQALNTFRGRVMNISNSGVPFANVTVTDDKTATYTDANGNFVLTSPDSVINVQVRSLGYDDANAQLRNNLPSNTVILQEDRRNLSEVAVIGQQPNSAARAKDGNLKVAEASPLDGWENYDRYLVNNLRVPKDIQLPGSTAGNFVQVSFEVSKNGNPVSIRIEKSLCSSCDKEAIRLIKEGPKWIRGTQKNSRVTVTVNF